jgi:hypothetical protein
LMRRTAEEWIPYLVTLEPWDYIVHLTFADRVGNEYAEKVWSRYLVGVERRVDTWFVKYARGTEYQRRGALHYHSLLEIGRSPAKITRDSFVWICRMLRECWSSVGGGYAWAHPYTQRQVRYVCKYVSKGGELDVGEYVKKGHVGTLGVSA